MNFILPNRPETWLTPSTTPPEALRAFGSVQRVQLAVAAQAAIRGSR